MFFLAAGVAWVLSLPPEPIAEIPPRIAHDETAATIAALKSRKRHRPLIAIIGINDATEVTDYIMPNGIIRRADVADVLALAVEKKPMKLFPALKVEPDATLAEFDAQHPQGADYVIVPAMSRDDDPTVAQWIRNQSARGAFVLGVCAGAKIVAHAGLLEGKRATTHWYYLDELLKKNPTIRHVPNRRIVVDGNVATTTGISATMPVSLMLIEAIAGTQKAQEVAQNLGITNWDAGHESQAFKFTRPFALTAIFNRIAIWNYEEIGVKLSAGVDEVSLALVADAWSRTYRSHALTFADLEGPIQTRNGMRVYPDRVSQSWPTDRMSPSLVDLRPKEALDQTLLAIRHRYGESTARFAAMQLEYTGH
jgi:transcriptional regulator GlxA family with amidase domain